MEPAPAPAPAFDMFGGFGAAPEPAPAPAMQRAQAAARPHGAVGISFESFVDEGLQIGSEVIGRGANGIVYRGTLARAEGEVPVAVKMLAPGATPTEHD